LIIINSPPSLPYFLIPSHFLCLHQYSLDYLHTSLINIIQLLLLFMRITMDPIFFMPLFQEFLIWETCNLSPPYFVVELTHIFMYLTRDRFITVASCSKGTLTYKQVKKRSSHLSYEDRRTPGKLHYDLCDLKSWEEGKAR
jgi:hypothetical protein